MPGGEPRPSDAPKVGWKPRPSKMLSGKCSAPVLGGKFSASELMRRALPVFAAVPLEMSDAASPLPRVRRDTFYLK